MDIFGTAFQGLRELGGVSFVSPCVELPDLVFSKYPAKPAVRVFEAEGELCSQPGVMAGKSFCRIAEDADQLIVANQWYPVQQDAYVAARLELSFGTPSWRATVVVIGRARNN